MHNFLQNTLFLVSYIKSVDGLVGCYRGLTPKLVGNVLSTYLSERVADKLGIAKVEDDEKDDVSDEEFYQRFEKDLKRSVVCHAAGTVICSPFHVISIRMMAQFVGRETKYTSIFGSIVQIYKDEGILGFFAGLIPRLLFDISCVVVASTASYLIGRHFIREKEGRQYLGSLSSVISLYAYFDCITYNIISNLFLVCMFKHFLSIECCFNVYGGQWIRVRIYIILNDSFISTNLF